MQFGSYFLKKPNALHKNAVTFRKTNAKRFIEVTFRKKLTLYAIPKILFKVTMPTLAS